MKNYKKLLTPVFIFLFSLSSFAQGGGVWNFDWNIGFGTGETSDFTPSPSLRGFSINGAGFVTDNLTVGGIAGWNIFYHNNGFTELQISNTATVYGYNRTNINTIPIMLTTHYYFSQTKMMPYAGLGVGTMYADQRNYMGIYYVQNKAWHFALAPEVGIIIPFGEGNTGVNANVKYNWAAKTKDTPSITYFTINIGLSYVF